MTKQEIILIVLTVLGSIVTFGIPIATALWKLSALKEKITDQVQELDHRLEMLKARVDNLDDRATLGINGLRELIEHRSARIATSLKDHESRVTDTEQFLAKTTPFERRNRG